MAYVLVFAVALATGALVFWLTLRAGPIDAAVGPQDGEGFLPEPPSEGPRYAPRYARADEVYVPVGSDRRSWQTRTVGVLGLLIAITLAAALLAFSIYEAGAFVTRMIRDFAS